MTISYAAAGTVVTGSGASPVLSPVPPTSGTDYVNILMIVWKSSSVAEPVITSSSSVKWKRLGVAKSGSVVATGADVGSVSTLIYYAYKTSPTGTAVTFSDVVGSAQAVIFNYTKSSTDSWILAYATGADDTVGANYSASMTTSYHAGGAEDTVVNCTGVNSDAGTFSLPTMTATGLTFGTVTNRIKNQSATGDDSTILVDDADVPSGTQTDVTIVGYTNASSTQGSTVSIRLRTVVSPTIVATPIDPFYTSAGYNIFVDGLTHYGKFRVYRDDSTNRPIVDVRGGAVQTVASPSWSADDFEFSFGDVGILSADNDVTYYLDVYDDQNVVLFTANEVVTPYEDWLDSLEDEGVTARAAAKTFLSVPDIPSINTPVLIQEFTEYRRSGNILSNSHVLGRSNPVINSDVMSGRMGSFSILVCPVMDMAGGSGAISNVDSLITKLQLGQIYMLRQVQPSAAGLFDFFFIIDDVSVSRLSRVADQSLEYGSFEDVNSIHAVEISFIEQDRPDNTSAVSAFSWQDVSDSNISWQSVLDGNIDWLQVLQTGGAGS